MSELGPFPLYPPRRFFRPPKDMKPGAKLAAITEGPDAGRVFGYVAPWDQCLLGQSDPRTCFKAPPSPTGYAAAMQGDTVTAEGDVISTANIGGDVNHVPLFPGEFAQRVVDHYANTASQVMRVVYGEDDYGIWAAGALWPNVDELTVAKARAAGLSGDWRWRPELGAYDMAGAQMVSTPGFPLMRGVAAACPAHPVLVGGMGGVPAEWLEEATMTEARTAQTAACSCQHEGKTAAKATAGDLAKAMIDGQDGADQPQGDGKGNGGNPPPGQPGGPPQGEPAADPNAQATDPNDPNAPPPGPDAATVATGAKLKALEGRLAVLEAESAQSQAVDARLMDMEAAIAELADGQSNINKWLADVAASGLDEELAMLDDEEPAPEPDPNLVSDEQQTGKPTPKDEPKADAPTSKDEQAAKDAEDERKRKQRQAAGK